ncbi:DUF3267 domain-containing protein [Salipaludibacillus aurantiacus]|uniref:Putative zincin peptidase n=1 Tax=Salipaludibacillus aurantiacus TaxID=1601833 RepID=A0A1H9RP45_9BACI|nr:DUF3267 domain-containing protein [Salipaludibacillus aurantiacus]SER73863.1 Putative zincin peptidase [Salipaludibacillus aurantiacus]
MNCLKTISVETQFGKMRLWFLSSLIMMGYFLIFFMVFRTFFFAAPLVDYGAIFLLLSLAVVLPLHLVLHCLPIWLVGKKATFGIRKNQWPYFYYSTKQPLSKHMSLLSTASPAFLLTAVSIAGAFLFPHLVHYIAMMSALNVGICVYDFMNFKQIKSAPKECLIEETRDGFYVLYPTFTDSWKKEPS